MVPSFFFNVLSILHNLWGTCIDALTVNTCNVRSEIDQRPTAQSRESTLNDQLSLGRALNPQLNTPIRALRLQTSIKRWSTMERAMLTRGTLCWFNGAREGNPGAPTCCKPRGRLPSHDEAFKVIAYAASGQTGCWSVRLRHFISKPWRSVHRNDDTEPEYPESRRCSSYGAQER